MTRLPTNGRRRFLMGAGAVTVLLAGGGVFRAVERGVLGMGRPTAYEPWERFADASQDGPLAVVRAAILAANPHNTQPWRFSVTETRIDVFADESRNLGPVDPFRREMMIGLGCAIENMVQSASAYGYHANVQLLPGGEATHVARVDLSPAPRRPSPLFASIPRRHTNRGPYDTARSVPPEVTAALEDQVSEVELVRLRRGSDAGRRFEALVLDATRSFVADADMVHESDRWFRSTPREVEKHRDGPAITVAGLDPVTETLAILGPEMSAQAGHEHWLAATRDVHCATASGFGLLATADRRSRASNLKVGRAWQRMHLEAVRHGLAMHPLNQACEMVDRQEQLGGPRDFAGRLDAFAPGGQVAFAFRYGYAVRAAGPSARRALRDVVA